MAEYVTKVKDAVAPAINKLDNYLNTPNEKADPFVKGVAMASDKTGLGRTSLVLGSSAINNALSLVCMADV